MKFNIRKMVFGDKNAFFDMSREFYSSPAVLHDIKYDNHIKAFEELMRSDEYLICLMIEKETEPVGYALLNKMFCREAGGIVIWTEELYIRPEHRGEGAGTEFFHWLEKNVPAARYRLEVEPDNKGACELYKRMGYESLPYVQMMKEK